MFLSLTGFTPGATVDLGTLRANCHSKHSALYIGGLWLCNHALDSCISFTCPSVGGCWVDKFCVTSRLSCSLQYCITAAKGNSRDSNLGDGSSRNSYCLLSLLGTGCSRFTLEIAGGIAEMVLGKQESPCRCTGCSLRKPDFMTQFSIQPSGLDVNAKDVILDSSVRAV